MGRFRNISDFHNQRDEVVLLASKWVDFRFYSAGDQPPPTHTTKNCPTQNVNIAEAGKPMVCIVFTIRIENWVMFISVGKNVT